jgi:heat shock protein HslJ
MFMRVVRSLALSALVCATLTGCSMFETTKPTGVKPIIPKSDRKSSAFPYDRTMVAVSYKDQAFQGDRPTILVSQNYRGTGFSACNNWSATVLPKPTQQLAIGPVAISKRQCDKRLTHNEQVFLFVMRYSQSWTFDGRTLTFTGPFGTMKFEPAL